MIKRLLLAVGLVIACSPGQATMPQPPVAPPPLQLQAVVVTGGLAAPLYLTAPVGDARLFVVEQAGRIRIVKNGQLLARPFLDITGRISSGGERGLLSVAFHPRYATNGYFYVNYTDLNGDTRIERYQVSTNADSADTATAKLILGIAQPFANHNGGHILFGADGMLYAAMGDGGSGGDPQGNGQNLGTLLGKLLRIDVDGGDPYAVPPDNPFVSRAGARGEVWAYGLRNPWRIAFDRAASLLYVADVGQNAWEEVNVQPAASPGLNYGWNVMEGKHCYVTSTCSTTGLVIPDVEYGHSEGCAVVGGYVYRGAAIPRLVGHYFYSDNCTGFLRTFTYANGTASTPTSWSVGSLGNVTSFGEDAAGELYITSGSGIVYRIAEKP